MRSFTYTYSSLFFFPCDYIWLHIFFLPFKLETKSIFVHHHHLFKDVENTWELYHPCRTIFSDFFFVSIALNQKHAMLLTIRKKKLYVGQKNYHTHECISSSTILHHGCTKYHVGFIDMEKCIYFFHWIKLTQIRTY